MQTANKTSVGVVIRTKDRPIFVTRALATVQAQRYDNWQIMLVNDGGDAATLAKAISPRFDKLKQQGRLTVLTLNPGEGRSSAFNRGVAALDTDFVACLDDDDTWDPDFLSALVAFYSDTKATVPDLAGVAAQVTALKEDFFDTAQGREIRVIGEEGLPPSFRRGEFFLNPLAYACYRQDIYPVQWILRRDAVLQVGGFPEHFDVMEDRAFMNKFLGHFRLAILDRKLAYHHRRAARTKDNTRSVLMNTLDNPSYDWRLFADLARPAFDLGSPTNNAAVIRSFAADLLSELNYETSAIWQKVDGDIRRLAERLDSDKAEIQAALTALMAELMDTARPSPAPAAPRLPESAAQPAAYDLWQVLGNDECGQYIAPGVSFAERIELSRPYGEEGLLLHVSPATRQLAVQIPDTREWTAIELRLDGLDVTPGGLRVSLQLSSTTPYLFETALVCREMTGVDAPAFRFSAYEVHSCSSEVGCTVTREIDTEWLQKSDQPKLSIILPRQARNFSFICKSFRIETL